MNDDEAAAVQSVAQEPSVQSDLTPVEVPPLQPPTPSPQPIPSSPQPIASSPQPTASSSQPIPSSPQPIASSPQPTVPSPQPIPSSPQRTVPSPQPIASSPQPIPSSPQPIPSSPQPIPSSPQPIASSPQPIASSTQPIASTPQPIASFPQSFEPSPQPSPPIPPASVLTRSPKSSKTSAGRTTVISPPLSQLITPAASSPTKISDKEYRSPKTPSPKNPALSPTKKSYNKSPKSVDLEYSNSKSRSPKPAVPSPIKVPNKDYRSPKTPSPKYTVLSPTEMSYKSLKSQSIKSDNLGNKIVNAINKLQPNDKNITDDVENFNDTVKDIACEITESKSSNLTTNIDKIATMSKALTAEANALKKSLKYLSEDIERTKQECCYCKDEDVNFPYHLFLIEMIINKIHMKCECFDIDYNNLVISAVFLGKQPIVLYDSSYGKIENFSKINVGKSIMFAMTYDKICSIKEFEIVLLLTKQPPCSKCVSNIAETRMDFTDEFQQLREELCKKWMQEQPTDNILCTTSSPLSKNMYYLSCCDVENRESIGVIEVAVRMSFLGKEITTAYRASPKPRGTSFLLKEDQGMSMYSCQKVEMDDQGKILLDEAVMTEKPMTCPADQYRMSESIISSSLSRRSYNRTPVPHNDHAGLGEFRIRDLNDEINKLMREKRHWEVQIKALGGPDHARVGPKMLDQDGKEVPGNRGYKYFGAAKDLPGVRELFEQEPPPPPRRTRADLMRDVDADYYGYRDDDDGLLMPLEQEAEKEAVARAVEEWKRNKEQDKDQDLPEEENIYPEDPDDKRIEEEENGEPTRPIVTSHVAVPSQKDIEEALLRRKKQELLEKYGCMDVKMEPS